MGKLYIKRKYGQTPNELLNNPDITLKAKGMFGLLQSKPDGWEFSTERLANQTKEGSRAVRSALQELEKYGHLQREPKRSKKGFDGYNYVLYEKEHEEHNVSSQNERTRYVSSQNRQPLSKKENSKKEVVIKSKTPPSKNSKFDYYITDLLKNKIINNNPLYHDVKDDKGKIIKKGKELKINVETWANNIRLMRTVDRLTEEQIEFLVNWSQDNEFWKTNILSTSKLRKQTPTLILQAKEDSKKLGITINVD